MIDSFYNGSALKRLPTVEVPLAAIVVIAKKNAEEKIWLERLELYVELLPSSLLPPSFRRRLQ